MKSMWRDDLPMTKNPLRFFLFASKPHWRAAIAAILLATAGNAFSASVSYVFKLIGDAAASLAAGGSYDALFLATGAALFFLARAQFFWRVAGFAGARWGTGT